MAGSCHSQYSVEDDWDGPVLVVHRIQGVGEGVSPRGVIPTPVEYASNICKYKLTKFTINAARVEPANRLRYQSSEVRDGLTINNKKYHWSKDQREYHWARGPASITPRGFNPYRRGWIQGGGSQRWGLEWPWGDLYYYRCGC